MSDKPEKEKKKKKEKPKKEKKAKKEKLPKPSNNKVKVCPECKAEIPKKAQVCPHCAAKQKGRNPLLLVMPLTLVLVLGAGVSLFAFQYPIEPPFELPFEIEIPFINGPKFSETALGQGMELTPEQENAMKEVFDLCGIKEITKVDQIGTDSATTSYAVQDVDTERFMPDGEGFTVRVENEDRSVRSIIYQDNPIYSNNEVLSQITDYYMDMSERDVYMETAVNEVKARLDLPEVAVFPSRTHWTFTELEDRVLIVEAYVTTKDGSGKETDRPFQVRFEKGKFQSVTFLPVGGENGEN